MGVYADFKKFLVGGNLVTMAVAFVIGLALVNLVKALVTDIVNPLIGAAGHVDFSQLGIVTLNNSPILGGAFLGEVINFLVLMVVIFFTIAYPYQKYQERKAARAAPKPVTQRDCPYCFSSIPVKATRCGFCTSTVTPSG